MSSIVVVVDCRYEAVTFIILYLVYILLMYFNSSLEMWLVPKFSCCGVHDKADDLDVIVMVAKENGHSQKSNGVPSDPMTMESRFLGQGILHYWYMYYQINICIRLYMLDIAYFVLLHIRRKACLISTKNYGRCNFYMPVF